MYARACVCLACESHGVWGLAGCVVQLLLGGVGSLLSLLLHVAFCVYVVAVYLDGHSF